MAHLLDAEAMCADLAGLVGRTRHAEPVSESPSSTRRIDDVMRSTV